MGISEILDVQRTMLELNFPPLPYLEEPPPDLMDWYALNNSL